MVAVVHAADPGEIIDAVRRGEIQERDAVRRLVQIGRSTRDAQALVRWALAQLATAQ